MPASPGRWARVAEVALLLLLLATGSLGWLLAHHLLGPAPRFAGLPLEMAAASLALGVVSVGWVALLLAEVGSFSLVLLGLLWALLVGGLLVAGRWRWGQWPWQRPIAWVAPESTPLLPWGLPARAEGPLLALWLMAALALFFRPHEFLIGGADAGVYVNIAANVATTGALLIDDATLATLDSRLYPALLRPLPPGEAAPYYLLPGFYVPASPAGRIVPQFYPLHPVWQAVAHAAGGLRAALLATPLWGLLGSLALYLTARRLWGWPVALLALAGLTTNALQLWFARYPTTEMLTQYLIWTGLWAFIGWLRDEPPARLWAALAGLAWGAVFLVRIDTYFLLAFPVLGWLWRAATGRASRGDGWLFLPLLALAVHSVAHGVLFSGPYFFNLARYAVVKLGALLPLALSGALLGVLLLWRWRRGWRPRLARAHWQRPARLGGVLLVLLLALFGWFIRPAIGATLVGVDWYGGNEITVADRENLLRLGWYLTPLGIWAAVAGICLLIWRGGRAVLAFLGVGLLFALLYLWQLQANPHQVYVMRRYVPVVVPFFLASGAYALVWAASQRTPWLRGAAIAATLLWLGGGAWAARDFVGQVDHRGVAPQVAALSARFEPGAILIFNDPAAVGQGDFLGTPLRFLHGHTVFTLRDPAAAAGLLAPQLDRWLAEGRAVYWLGPTDQPGLLGAHALRAEGDYQIDETALESTYDAKPTRRTSWAWTGAIHRVIAAPTAEATP